MVFSSVQSPPSLGITARKQPSPNSSYSVWGIASVVKVLGFLHFPLFSLLFTALICPPPSTFWQFCSLISPSWFCPCPDHKLPHPAPTYSSIYQPELTKNFCPRMTLTFIVNKAFDWPCSASFPYQLRDNDFIPVLQTKKLMWVLHTIIGTQVIRHVP